MKIHNVRLGFATNSSSSHSLIFMPNNNLGDEILNDPGEFGWEPFTLASKEAKSIYVAAQLSQQLKQMHLPESAHKAIIQAWTGVEDYEGYVDHQSVYDLPKDFKGNFVHEGFFKAFKDFMLRDDVVILGGNDNDGHHPLSERGGFNLPIPTDYSGNTVARDQNGWFTLFHRDSGAKFRVSFDQPTDFKPTKSVAPELVDIKITDWCDAGCSYCYQNSTTKGQHADFSYMQHLVYALEKLEVFEVALGGGEPTKHPDFIKILKMFKDHSIVPNFTTRSEDWLKDGSAKEIISMVGACAVSINKAEDIIRFSDLAVAAGIKPTKMHFQYVMGADADDNFKSIVETLNKLRDRDEDHREHQLTLLGFKTVGRGTKFKQFHYGNWMATAQGYMKAVSIDTALAQQSIETLKDMKIPEYMYGVSEGDFSMYIDAVNHVAGPSSYCDEEKYVNTDKGSIYKIDDNIKEIFSKF